MNDNIVRLRFAPSPTGYLHVGGLRTALYNYFYAKQLKGKLVLRIEDTDQNRLVNNAEKDLIDMLLWAGVEFDEGPHIGGDFGPYRQSDRLSLYKDFYYDLIKRNHAYPCFYSDDRLKKLSLGELSTEDAAIEDAIFKDFDLDTIWDKMDKEQFVVRFKIPNNQMLSHHDLIKGEVKFDLTLINDPIIIKSDGFPTYHFANVIDDHLMDITHVIRGEEWLPSIPKHILLYNAFDWDVPQFGHLPLLLNNDKTKLSKRKNDVSVSSYIDKGYTKEALINFLALLGWHEKGDREIYSLDELIASFSFERVSKSGAVFNMQKLNYFNNHYIKNYPINQLQALLNDFYSKDNLFTDDMVELVREKIDNLGDFEKSLAFFSLEKISL
ncbi:MAG: glutamate--tRNA ligase, partial [Candidatus Marinimicrobia bacterium]|nr:glutamate--tRNA ligase [Candidatus Neomarinimicrobiota bacterium]